MFISDHRWFFQPRIGLRFFYPSLALFFVQNEQRYQLNNWKSLSNTISFILMVSTCEKLDVRDECIKLHTIRLQIRNKEQRKMRTIFSAFDWLRSQRIQRHSANEQSRYGRHCAILCTQLRVHFWIKTLYTYMCIVYTWMWICIWFALFRMVLGLMQDSYKWYSFPFRIISVVYIIPFFHLFALIHSSIWDCKHSFEL